MALSVVRQIEDLEPVLADTKKTAVVGFFTQSSEKSQAMEPHFKTFAGKHPDVPALSIDVREVPGIHKRFGVTVVPTVIFVRGEKVLKKVEGVHSEDMYERAWLGQGSAQGSGKDESARPRHNVTVYSTPTCSWCTRLKNYLRKRGVQYRDVDVSKDMRAAQALINRSGQTGVPQTDIDGHLVVGFDKVSIDRLLGLPPEPMN